MNELLEAIFEDARERMGKAVDHLAHELVHIRTGRATPALVEDLKVEAYGTVMRLQELATITAPEPRLLVIQPWDASTLKAIERAIQTSDLGLTPNNDGRVIRLVLPQLTEERRRELVKLVHKRVEETRIAIRNIRRDAIDEIRTLEKEKEISEDESHRAQDQVQKLTDEFIEKAEKLGEKKEAEILEV